METLLDALAQNWQGYENLRQQIIARAPKYANDQADADEIGRELLGYFSDRTRFHAQRYPTIIFPCAVGTFSWYTSIGREVSASSDGRFAQDPITPNFSPSFGMDLAGPTAAIRSYCRMNGADLAGGAPLDLRFAGSHLRGEAGTGPAGGVYPGFHRPGRQYADPHGHRCRGTEARHARANELPRAAGAHGRLDGLFRRPQPRTAAPAYRQGRAWWLRGMNAKTCLPAG